MAPTLHILVPVSLQGSLSRLRPLGLQLFQPAPWLLPCRLLPQLDPDLSLCFPLYLCVLATLQTGALQGECWASSLRMGLPGDTALPLPKGMGIPKGMAMTVL